MTTEINMEMINELKQEESKYRKLYEDKLQPNYILEGLKADAFKLAIQKLENKGLEETYNFFKKNRDKFSDSYNALTRGLANAYGLVVGKLWKYRKPTKNKKEAEQ